MTAQGFLFLISFDLFSVLNFEWMAAFNKACLMCGGHHFSHFLDF